MMGKIIISKFLEVNLFFEKELIIHFVNVETNPSYGIRFL